MSSSRTPSSQLRKILPTHFIFNHPLFSSPAFLQYEQHALRTIETADDPADMRLRQAMPILAATMKTGFDAVMQASREQASRSDASEKIDNALATMLADVLTGVAPIRLSAEWPRSASGPPSNPVPDPEPVASTSSAPPQPTPSASTSSTNPLATILALTAGSATTSSAATSSFTMSRTISTVADLWREYSVGIGGRPSVQSQYEVKGHSWAKNDSERKHFQRRMVVVKKIKQLASEHTVREVDVAARLDEFCRTSSPKISLSKLQDIIKSKTALDLQF